MARTVDRSSSMGTKTPENPTIGYKMMLARDCANLAVGTMLAIRKPIERMVAVQSATRGRS